MCTHKLIMFCLDSIKPPPNHLCLHTFRHNWHLPTTAIENVSHWITFNRFSPTTFLSLAILFLFCDVYARAGASKVACNGQIPAASLGCSLFLLFYICHQAFWKGLLWEPCWREICLCTLTHTWHPCTINA